MTASAVPDEASDGWTAELQRVGGDGAATMSSAFGDVTITIPVADWVGTLSRLRDNLSLSFFDWLSAVDEGDGQFTVFCHLYDPNTHHHVLARTTLLPGEERIGSLTSVFRGAAWHERETAEMFGIHFVGHPYPQRLLLSDEFVGHPLRKSFVLTSRVSKSWPGAKEPGESGEGSPSRRKMQPPGVPDPAWGPHESGSVDG
ncbi:MAG: NADH-quinone oxidoreductase subunit C [Actinomycetes bacterium]|jgi:NADH-quinone oxidoreductase subunit C